MSRSGMDSNKANSDRTGSSSPLLTNELLQREFNLIYCQYLSDHVVHSPEKQPCYPNSVLQLILLLHCYVTFLAI